MEITYSEALLVVRTTYIETWVTQQLDPSTAPNTRFHLYSFCRAPAEYVFAMSSDFGTKYRLSPVYNTRCDASAGENGEPAVQTVGNCQRNSNPTA